MCFLGKEHVVLVQYSTVQQFVVLYPPPPNTTTTEQYRFQKHSARVGVPPFRRKRVQAVEHSYGGSFVGHSAMVSRGMLVLWKGDRSVHG